MANIHALKVADELIKLYCEYSIFLVFLLEYGKLEHWVHFRPKQIIILAESSRVLAVPPWVSQL